jgi:hypothetical protein
MSIKHFLKRIDATQFIEMSTHKGIVSFFCRCLKVILFSALILSGPIATATERQPVILMANQGLFYFLHMAINDEAFAKDLKPEEKQMADKLYQVLEQVSALRWFNENQVEFYPTTKNGRQSYLFAYVDAEDQITKYNLENRLAPKVIFSSESEKFKGLKAGEGERGAKTNSEFSSPIEFNLNRLNSESDEEFKKFDLGKAVSLLIHEYGHKLGPVQENLEAIYSLGNKLGEFVRGRVNTHPLKNGTTLYSLHFNQFKYGEWMGEFQAPEMPGHQIIFKAGGGEPSFSRNGAGLPIFANQGLYVWAEQGQNYSDLTANVQKKLTIEGLVK